MDKESESPWMTVEETAKYLRCSLRYLRERIANKEIPLSKFGGKSLFNRKRIDEWMFMQEENVPSLNVDSASQAEPSDTSILDNCDRDQINSLIQELIDFNEHFVSGLGNNLKDDLREYNYEKLSDKVYAQLSRWCHPNRDSERERNAKPIVHKISENLFGCIIKRIKHPSYRG